MMWFPGMHFILQIHGGLSSSVTSSSAISVAVLHHLSTEKRRKKAVEELVRVKPGFRLQSAEQEDKSLLTKWTPLSPKYVEEWVGPGSPMNSPRVRNNPFYGLASIPETGESTREQKAERVIETKDSLGGEKDENSVEEALESLKMNQHSARVERLASALAMQ